MQTPHRKALPTPGTPPKTFLWCEARGLTTTQLLCGWKRGKSQKKQGWFIGFKVCKKSEGCREGEKRWMCASESERLRWITSGTELNE